VIDPSVGRGIARVADVGPGDRVLDIGAGFGSLTMALADTGAHVLAVEFDRGLVRALRDVVAGRANVEVLAADALSRRWRSVLRGAEWAVVANLPYNIATPLLLDMLEHDPTVRRYVVMVQREVGERLAARPGDEGYGAVSLKIAYRADATLLRRIPPDVFWPRPRVESVLVRLARKRPAVGVDARRLFAVIDAGFAERRKTMRNALRRLGLDGRAATDALVACGIDERARAEEIDLEGFACLAAVSAVAAAVDALGGRSTRG
jgi:16S rRNA (adenine1518-N6/adenine1519-N6)-dimethyltransferase